MSDQKSYHSEHGVMSSAELASDYARRMIGMEARGGAVEEAMSRLEAKTGIGFWTLRALWHRRPKTIDRDLFNSIRSAYLALCERQISTLKHDLAVEQAKGGEDDLGDLVREAETLAAKLRAAKEAMG